jgi:hypothetical protein
MCYNYLSNEYPKCEHWIDTKAVKPEGGKTNKDTGEILPWSGVAFNPENIHLISSRSNPIIIGMVGTADAGKTSYLSMLFRLLFNGRKFNNWQFAGSYTLSAWETLAQYVVIRNGGEVNFPPPTPSNPDFYSLYHLALRQVKLFRDVLFADSSGEVFLKWANDVNDEGAENARWIYQHSDAFVFFVDCEALIKRRGAAVVEIRQMAEQLANDLHGRPVILVWSKSDLLESIRPNIKNPITEDLNAIFSNPVVLEISNISVSDHDPSCHENNLVVVEAILEALNSRTYRKLEPELIPSNDLFITYRGKYDKE